MSNPRNRRQFLSLMGSAGLTGLAGCGGNSELAGTVASTASETPTAASTETDNPTETETPEKQWEIDPVEHDKLIGAHYYIEYGGDRVGRNTFEDTWLDFTPAKPVLGGYDSSDPDVINQHVQWAVNHGINWFPCSWHRKSTGYQTDRVLKDAFPEAELIDEIDFSILYESKTNLNFERDDAIDFDMDDTRDLLWDDLRYFEENYFQRDNYLRIDGRPVVYFWATSQFEGDAEGAFKEAKASLSEEPYLITDILSKPEDLHEDWASEFDAATTYSPLPYRRVGDYNFDEMLDEVMYHYRTWSFATEYAGLDFIPTVMPGFNNTHIDWRPESDHIVLERSPERFTQFCERVMNFLDQDLDAVWVTSFNEWPEFTAVEPAEEYATTYLDIIEEELAKGEPDYPSVEDYNLLELHFSDTYRPAEYVEESNDDRPLAFMLGELDFLDVNGELLKQYDIGVRGKEPVFVEGVYGTESAEDKDIKTWRWLGGPTETAAMYVDRELSDAVKASIYGKPKFEAEGGLTADIFWNNEQTDQVMFDDSISEYPVSLTQ